MNRDQQFPATESESGIEFKAVQLARIATLVEDMHHRLFGNGQPGIVKEYDTRIGELESQKDKVTGVIHFVKLAAVVTPVIVAAAEWFFHKG